MLQLPLGAVSALSILVIAASALPGIAADEWSSQPELRQFTEMLFSSGRLAIHPPIIEYSDHFLTYDLSSMLDYDLDHSFMLNHDRVSVLNAALREQIIVTNIRSHRNSPAQKLIWAPVLRHVEADIQQILALQDSTSDDVLNSRIQAITEDINSTFDAFLSATAKERGLEVRRQAAAPAAQTYIVKLTTDPPGGTISYIDSGLWELYHLATVVHRRTDITEPPWITQTDTSAVEMYGIYWFRVNWPDGTMTKQLLNVKNGNVVFTHNGFRQVH